MNPTITLIGRLITDPHPDISASGVTMTTFTVGIADHTRDRTGHWHNRPALQVTCRAWRQLAENITDSGLRRGDRVVIAGRLRHGDAPDNQIELIVDDIGLSLRNALSSAEEAGTTHPIQL
jgi:single-strand DNA-binding protein